MKPQPAVTNGVMFSLFWLWHSHPASNKSQICNYLTLHFWSKHYIKQMYHPSALESLTNIYDMTWHPDEHSIYSAILVSEAGSIL